jgi:hypothetical protein
MDPDPGGPKTRGSGGSASLIFRPKRWRILKNEEGKKKNRVDGKKETKEKDRQTGIG